MYLILHVYIRFMMLSCSYLGHICDTVLVPNLHFETKSGRKYQEIIYKDNLIRDYLKGI